VEAALMQGARRHVTWHRQGPGRGGTTTVDDEGWVTTVADDEVLAVPVYPATVAEQARAATAGLAVSVVVHVPLHVDVAEQDRFTLGDDMDPPLRGTYDVSTIKPNALHYRVLGTRVEP
jgi:hypothetical protein